MELNSTSLPHSTLPLEGSEGERRLTECQSTLNDRGLSPKLRTAQQGRRLNIAVYCASSTKIHPDFFAAACALGEELARRGIGLINGAGHMGLMGASSNACLEAGGEVTGVIPSFMVEQNWHHTGLTRLVETRDMHERKQTIADLSDGCIALPGGCGTLEELMEVITWKQLGLYLKPIVILNTRGYYDPLLQQLQRGIDEHFMGPRHASIWQVAQTPEQAIDLVLSTPLWDPSIRKFAAI